MLMFIMIVPVQIIGKAFRTKKRVILAFEFDANMSNFLFTVAIAIKGF